MSETRNQIVHNSADRAVDKKNRWITRVAIGVAFLCACLCLGVFYLAWEKEDRQADAGTKFATQFQQACKDPTVRIGDLDELCDRAEKVVESADNDDPEIQDNEIQDPEFQEEEIQDPEFPDAETQDREKQDAELQEAETQEDELQESEVQDEEVQDPEVQDEEVNDPDPNDPQDPAATLIFQGAGPGNQDMICTRNAGSDPTAPTYTCTLQQENP